MAHRVAELMQRAEAATDPTVKEAAEQESQDLIIRLWEMRDFWPRGGPLAPLLPTLHQLLDQQGYPIGAFYRKARTRRHQWVTCSTNASAPQGDARALRISSSYSAFRYG